METLEKLTRKIIEILYEKPWEGIVEGEYNQRADILGLNDADYPEDSIQEVKDRTYSRVEDELQNRQLHLPHILEALKKKYNGKEVDWYSTREAKTIFVIWQRLDSSNSPMPLSEQKEETIEKLYNLIK